MSERAVFGWLLRGVAATARRRRDVAIPWAFKKFAPWRARPAAVARGGAAATRRAAAPPPPPERAMQSLRSRGSSRVERWVLLRRVTG